MKWVEQKTAELDDRSFGNSLAEAQAKVDEFGKYKSSEKPPKTAAKLDIEALYNTISLKLKANGRPQFVPPEGIK